MEQVCNNSIPYLNTIYIMVCRCIDIKLKTRRCWRKSNVFQYNRHVNTFGQHQTHDQNWCASFINMGTFHTENLYLCLFSKSKDTNNLLTVSNSIYCTGRHKFTSKDRTISHWHRLSNKIIWFCYSSDHSVLCGQGHRCVHSSEM